MYNNYYTLITGASEGCGKALAFECTHGKIIFPDRINQLFMSLNKFALKKIKKINTSHGMNKIVPHHSLRRYLTANPYCSTYSSYCVIWFTSPSRFNQRAIKIILWTHNSLPPFGKKDVFHRCNVMQSFWSFSAYLFTA